MREYASGAEMRAAYGEVRARLMRGKFPVEPQVFHNPVDMLSLSTSGCVSARLCYGIAVNASTMLPPSIVTAEDILFAVCREFRITKAELISRRRTRHIVRARHIAMHFMRRERLLSYPQIGKMLGKMDHTSVLHGVNKVINKSGFYEPFLTNVSRRLGVSVSGG